MPRERRIIFAVNDEEDKKIKQLADKNGMSVSAYIRWRILFDEPDFEAVVNKPSQPQGAQVAETKKETEVVVKRVIKIS